MTILVLAEKPSVARDIAAVLGARRRRQGYLEGAGYRVTWAIGHLVGLAEPGAIDPTWKAWSFATLPMLPKQWPLSPRGSGARSPGPASTQLDVVRRLLGDESVQEVVCATDAGREGELIFRYIYEHLGCDKPVRRLWISSLTPESIRRGFAKLAPSARFDDLAAAARARSRADWLVGMNLSRAYSLSSDDTFSVGRVQTPTLAMLVDREHEILGFVPEPYHEVHATFRTEVGSYGGRYVHDEQAPKGRLSADGEASSAVAARALEGTAVVRETKRNLRRMAPPRLYDLTELQRHAHRLYGLSAKRTLELAQELYEKHKLLSYPRTDSRHLSTDVAQTLGPITAAISPRHGDAVAPGTTQRAGQLGKRFVDDGKVTDHHAILPTATPCELSPETDAFKVYDLVCRRLLQAWHEDHVDAVTRVLTCISGEHDGQAFEDSYRSRGTTVEQVGWKVLDVPLRRGRGERGRAKKADLPGGLRAEMPADVTDAHVQDKTTKPPRRFDEATLLTAMETAGRALDDKELSDAMRERGLGTPATRAATIETLLARDYLVRDGSKNPRSKTLRATDKGIALVAQVHERVRSPAMTGEWEHRLARMARGLEPFDDFMRDIERFVVEVVGATRRGGPSGAPRRTSEAPAAGGHQTHAHPGRARAPTVAPVAKPRPASVGPEGLPALLRETFGFSAFRPHQEEICATVTRGRDALVVMPTGAGKSLCYQLPGLARGGTTLVISPLVALIEDQVQKLQALGLAAERIHAGRGRAASRAVCVAYLEGRLDFLFVAPERLAVRGFPQMLAKRPPRLIAIDEAHCISDWGHDFRPDYRMLERRLAPLRSAPVVALTATATPRVQADICRQLGLDDAREFILGFRRTNIAVEVVEVPAPDRGEQALGLLREPGRVPAIVYASTRKSAEEQAASIGRRLRAGAYHAGMGPEARDSVQQAFTSGELDVVVATVAFGMGIDKADVRTVVHTALPATLEGYYQEIGRAGRDGAPSRAVLMHSFADVRTLEFFLERGYPPTSKVARVYSALGPTPVHRELLHAELDAKPQDAELWLSKLWVSGGASVDDDGLVRRGDRGWRARYEAQRAHKEAQLAAVRGFARGSSCHMRALVRHFGDRSDGDRLCGICDVCAPKQALLRQAVAPNVAELALMADLLDRLREWNDQATGRLHRELCTDGAHDLDRPGFERVLAGLERAGVLTLRSDSFEKGGETIGFRRAHLDDADVAVADLEARVSFASASRASAAGPSNRKGGRRSGRRASRRGRSREPRGSRSSTLADIDAPRGVIDALRSWRLEESRSHRIPAYRILTDVQLGQVAQVGPGSEGELLEIRGIGRKKVERWGAGILQTLREAS